MPGASTQSPSPCGEDGGGLPAIRPSVPGTVASTKLPVGRVVLVGVWLVALGVYAGLVIAVLTGH